MSQCYFCQGEIQAPIYRSTECPLCGKDCKICFNCEFYSESQHWECRESIREAVREKDRSNYCDFFKLSKKGRVKDAKKTSVEAFNNLFGD